MIICAILGEKRGVQGIWRRIKKIWLCAAYNFDLDHTSFSVSERRLSSRRRIETKRAATSYAPLGFDTPSATQPALLVRVVHDFLT